MEGLELYAFRGFHLSSINPAWAVKRTLYNLDNISDQDRKDKLTQGHKDAVTIAAKVPEKMDDDKNSGTLQYWFGDKHINDGSKGKIGGVLIKIVGDKPEGTASNINGRTTVCNDNYWLPAKGDLGGVRDGTTGFCGLKNSDGKTAAAYYKRFNGGASIQYCDKTVSTKKWTKNFIGANVLHETMHVSNIGKDSVLKSVADFAYDAYQRHQLALDTTPNEMLKVDEKFELTIRNADTYVWYALDIAFQEICAKQFSEPRDETGDDDDAID